MIRTLSIFIFMMIGALGYGQEESIKTVVLINGVAHLVKVTPKGNITDIYQEIDNYFTTSESHKSIVNRLSKDASPQGGSIVFFEMEEEPEPSYSEENKKPIDIGNDQYLGFSPGKALLEKVAVDQIRTISENHTSGKISHITITSYYISSYRSRALARNRAEGINDLLIAFGVPSRDINRSTLAGNQDTKIEFVQLSFSK